MFHEHCEAAQHANAALLWCHSVRLQRLGIDSIIVRGIAASFVHIVGAAHPSHAALLCDTAFL
jgi:hypothetical protein